MDLDKLRSMLSLQSKLDSILKERAIKLGCPEFSILSFKNKRLYTNMLLYSLEFGTNSVFSDMLPYKREKLLDRLVSCWSSALSVALHSLNKDDIIIKVSDIPFTFNDSLIFILEKIEKLIKDTFGLINYSANIEEREVRYIEYIENNACQMLVELGRLTEALGFAFNEIYQRYGYLHIQDMNKL